MMNSNKQKSSVRMFTTANTTLLASISLATLFFGMYALSAHAEETTDTRQTPEERQAALEERQATREERRSEMASTSAARQAEREEKVAERRAALSEQIQKRVINLAANINNRIDAVITRLDNIIGRFETRITKLNDLGVDTAEAESHIQAAKDALDNARATITDIDTLVNESVASETPKEAWQAVRTIMTSVKGDLQTVKTELHAALAALKDAVAAAGLDRGVSSAVTNGQTNEQTDDSNEEDDAAASTTSETNN